MSLRRWKHLVRKLNKLLFTKLRGRTAAVLVSENRTLQIDFFPDQAVGEVGTIYVAKVRNIVRNLNAAFVEYEPGVNGYYSLSENKVHFFADGREHSLLKNGDEIIVQIARAAMKGKDAVLSSNLTLAGRYAVVTAGTKGLGISSRITDTAWKQRVREKWESRGVPCPFGIIVRTNAYQAAPEAIADEIRALTERMQALIKVSSCRTCYSILAGPDSFALQAAGNASDTQTEEIVTDIRELYEELVNAPDRGKPVRFYEDPFPLAALYHLESSLEQALSKKVWLKSGGYLVIEPTEAMTVIDVNTGKNTEKKSREETHFRTNLEAADEIALQLRLRNLSGIIIVDFIDMKKEDYQKKLLKRLGDALAADPIKAVLVDMTALGLAEITRKKIRMPLYEQLCSLSQPEPCRGRP